MPPCHFFFIYLSFFLFIYHHCNNFNYLFISKYYVNCLFRRYDVDINYVFPIPHKDCSSTPARFNYSPIVVDVGGKVKRPGISYKTNPIHWWASTIFADTIMTMNCALSLSEEEWCVLYVYLTFQHLHINFSDIVI